jgi:glycogen phosphorylase
VTATEAIRGRLKPSIEDFKREFLQNLRYQRGVDFGFATRNDLYQALGYTVRAYLTQAWLDTLTVQMQSRSRFVFYLSAEYLLGRQLDNALLNCGLDDVAGEAMAQLGFDLGDLAEMEIEPSLGNGGLGRLAACFLDSLATMRIPAVGYGIRYEYGIFRQTFVDGAQVEQPDEWLRLGCPWEFAHPELAVSVGFGGHTEYGHDDGGRLRVRWIPDRLVRGVPYNLMVPGHGSGVVNSLRLWSARGTEEFDLRIFNTGDYTAAVHQKVLSENISKVLYPDDSTWAGKELRLQQQYFFVACSLAEIISQLCRTDTIDRLADRVVIQLNDTHPVIAIPELMRLLIDEHDHSWERAWDVATRVFAYTCHTLLPEALETWPVELMARLLPRHLEIIAEIDRRFLDEARARNGADEDRLRRMAIISPGPEPVVRMANLATVGSFRVNGVAELHSTLLREKVLADFADQWPERFINVTNGVTPRRFVRLANPGLSELVTEAIGDGWLDDLERLAELEPHADDPAFREAWRRVKQANKRRLADEARRRTGVAVDPAAMADVMVKRMHLYKRQLLRVLHLVTAYGRIKADPSRATVARTVLFGAKAAPGYFLAKQVVRLVNAVASVVNADADVAGRLVVVYPPNYDVTMAQWVVPAADLSEQISTAGKEASGTGNMKLSLNGALTIGTLDGANVEIRRLVGAENFFLFGLTEDQVSATRAGGYDPRRLYEADAELRWAVDQIAGGRFSPGEPDLFRPLVDDLLGHDEFLVLADYAAYVACQDEVDDAWRDTEGWTRRSILNTARSGYFSSDRSIRDYMERVWRVSPA